MIDNNRPDNQDNSQKSESDSQNFVYEPPAIIYEGKITSRAGSPIPDAPEAPNPGGEKIDLFPQD